MLSDALGLQFDLFISSADADRAWVWDDLLSRLEKAGLRVAAIL